MRREQAETTRRHLVDVAKDLFARRGYDGTSIETVLEAAGVSRGALYHHFRSKEALFEAVYAAAQEEIAAAILGEAMKATSPLEMLRAGTRAWLSRVRDPVVHQITLIDAPIVLGWRKWREIDEQHFLGTIKEAMRAAAPDSMPPERIDYLAHMHFGILVETAMVIARGDRSDAAIDEAGKVVDEFLTRMLS